MAREREGTNASPLLIPIPTNDDIPSPFAVHPVANYQVRVEF